MDTSSMQEIFVLMRDVYRVVRAYAIPITSHALQVYHSVLATGSCCKLLSCVRTSQIVAPRLVSQRASDWSPAVQAIEGHTGGVNSVACSPDGTNIVSGSDDRTVRVWDAHTGKELAVLEGHSDNVLSVAFSPDGAHIVSGSFDKSVRVWSAKTGKEFAVLEGYSSAVWSVAFSPDGAHIASGSFDKTVQVWDAHTGKWFSVLEGHNSSVTSVAFAPDGTHIISNESHGVELAWNVRGTVAPPKQFYVQKLIHTSADVCGAEVMQAHTSPITHALHTRIEILKWDHQTGWISWRISDGTRLLPLCWIPVERRGLVFARHGTTAVIGATLGIVTILDLSDVIAMLQDADQALFT
jgi:WD40 repeat protein